MHGNKERNMSDLILMTLFPFQVSTRVALMLIISVKIFNDNEILTNVVENSSHDAFLNSVTNYWVAS